MKKRRLGAKPSGSLCLIGVTYFFTVLSDTGFECGEGVDDVLILFVTAFHASLLLFRIEALNVDFANGRGTSARLRCNRQYM